MASLRKGKGGVKVNMTKRCRHEKKKERVARPAVENCSLCNGGFHSIVCRWLKDLLPVENRVHVVVTKQDHTQDIHSREPKKGEKKK